MMSIREAEKMVRRELSVNLMGDNSLAHNRTQDTKSV